ncbi:MAG: hypothetical protein K0Q65_1711 [Clostridia bacterium]|jgi:hypothetical protein|nr:hypothetical protein [Clostridia bacterium]
MNASDFELLARSILGLSENLIVVLYKKFRDIIEPD